jgi:hypothetical protein
MKTTLFALFLAIPLAVFGQGKDAFDACQVLTQADAEKALGKAVAVPELPKGKKPVVSATCTWMAGDDSVSAQFMGGKTDAEVKKAFDEMRLQYQTKPVMLASGMEGFWSAKTGKFYALKGRTAVIVGLGSPRLNERDADKSRNLAIALLEKM